MNDVIREAAEMIVNLSEKLETANANGWLLYGAVERVRDLHKRSDNGGCMGCGINAEYCDWNETWPCATIRALDGIDE